MHNNLRGKSLWARWRAGEQASPVGRILPEFYELHAAGREGCGSLGLSHSYFDNL